MAQNGLAARVQTIHDSGKWSVLTIYCAGYEFLVHRNLVCSSSSYFDAACRGPQVSQPFKLLYYQNTNGIHRKVRLMRYVFQKVN